MAHPDDDLIFQSPDILHDLQSGRCLRTVYLTAGDAGSTGTYEANRESGVQAAYAQMAGVPNQWTVGDAGVQGRAVVKQTLTAMPQVSLVFLRLPDGGTDGNGFPSTGNQSLLKLWNSAIPQIAPLDGTAAYTRASLISTLAQLVSDSSSATVRAQDFVHEDGDHPDHETAAKFMQQASAAATNRHTLYAYGGYRTANEPANVAGADLTAKLAAINAYATYDPGLAGGGGFESMIHRQYIYGSVLHDGTSIPNRTPVANAGPDQLVAPGASVQLTGLGSSDPDGDALTYAWTQTAGPA
ncbi:MAG: PIG-L family deacetylase, partial [Dermatophilaceae bacterium]